MSPLLKLPTKSPTASICVFQTKRAFLALACRYMASKPPRLSCLLDTHLHPIKPGSSSDPRSVGPFAQPVQSAAARARTEREHTLQQIQSCANPKSAIKQTNKHRQKPPRGRGSHNHTINPPRAPNRCFCFVDTGKLVRAGRISSGGGTFHNNSRGAAAAHRTTCLGL